MLRRRDRATSLAALLIGAAASVAIVPPARAHDFLLLTGVDVTTRNNLYGYGGLITPIPWLGNTGSLAQDGFLFRLWGFGQRIKYSREGTSTVEASGGGVEAGLGYQVVRPGWRVSGYASYVFRSFDLSPDDTRTELRRRHGVRLQIEGYVDLVSNLGIEAQFNYTANWNTYWTRVRPYYRFFGDFRAGPEFTFLGGNEFDRQRYGAHVAGLTLGPANLSLGVGADRDVRKSSTSAYFNVGATFLFQTQ